MLGELKRNVTSYQPSSGPFFCSIILFSITALAIAALWHAHWSLTSIRCICILEDNYTFAGHIELGGASVHWDLIYNIPGGELEHVSIRGPLKRGIAAGPPDFALTLCGGDLPCSSVEAHTCLKEHPHTNISDCARLAATAEQLDTTSPDAGTKIHRTLSEIAEHPNLYIIVVEANGESFRQGMGPICRKPIHLPRA